MLYSEIQYYIVLAVFLDANFIVYKLKALYRWLSAHGSPVTGAANAVKRKNIVEEFRKLKYTATVSF